MRRTLVTILAALALGAATSLAVAWIAVFRHESQLSQPALEGGRLVYLESSWGFLKRTDCDPRLAARGVATPAPQRELVIREDRAGWPLPCVRCVWSCGTELASTFDFKCTGGLARKKLTVGSDADLLPFWPTWPGFAVDSAALGLAWLAVLLIASGRQSLYRRYWRARDRCPCCRYDTRGSPESRCPECGEPFARRVPIFAGRLSRLTPWLALLLIVAEAAYALPFAFDSPDFRLMEAVYRGNIEGVREYLSAGADLECVLGVGPGDLAGATPLAVAVSTGNRNIVELLLKAGADVDAVNAIGQTAMMIAASRGDRHLVEVLIRSGAAADAVDASGTSALGWAALAGHLATMDALLAAGADVNGEGDVTPLLVAALAGRAAAVDALLRAGAGVEGRGSRGVTPLMGAAQRADAHTIEILLLAGADIEASSDDGLTPLMFAASAGNSETVDALLRAGADVRAVDPVRGWNALFWAVPADEAPDAWRSLTAAYGDVSRMPATPTGMTLLMRKAAQADRAAIEFLLDAGADPLAVDEHGRTADQYADPRAAELVYQAVLARLRP